MQYVTIRRLACLFAVLLLIGVGAQYDDDPAELKLCQSLLEEVETKLKSCTANVAKGNKDIGDWKDQAADAQEQLALIKDKLKTLEKDHAEAKKEIASLTRTISQTRASYKVADSEAALLRERAAEAEDALEQCQREQSTAILPKWMEEYVQGTLVQAWYSAQSTLSQIKTVAIKAWNQQVFPLLKKLSKLSNNFAASAFSTGYEKISKVLKSTLPENALVAVSNIKTKLIDAWSSEMAVTIRQTLYASFKRLLKESDNIITELEGLLQQFAADIPVLSPLARKPFSRVAIVVLLVSPIVAIWFPYMASNRDRHRARRTDAASRRPQSAEGAFTSRPRKSKKRN